jgi:hypothetical protein
MLVLLVLVCSCSVVCSGRTSSVITSCTAVKPILEMKNLSLDIPDEPVNGKKMCRFYSIKRPSLSRTTKWRCLYLLFCRKFIIVFTC